MGIKLLSEGVWSRIAAGEVVERPASAVKEMVENSLDAKAKKIRVKLWDGGRVRIVVEDDGCGIAFDELPLALTPHATSKINGIEDLEAIYTLGYRGEALPSLVAVGKVEIRSRPAGESGGLIRACEGQIADHIESSGILGTRVQVDELFVNLPARRKFLKSAAGELRRTALLLREYAICRPEVAFSLEHDGRAVFSTDGCGNRRRVIERLWGAEPAIQYAEASVSRLELQCWWQPRPGRNDIASFVNGRAITDPLVKGALGAAAREMIGGWALFFSVDPSLIDVNIHPAKAEIRFRYPGEVFDVVKEATSRLGGRTAVPMRGDRTAAADEGWSFKDAAVVPPAPDGSAVFVSRPAFADRATSSFQATMPFKAARPDKLFGRVDSPDFANGGGLDEGGLDEENDALGIADFAPSELPTADRGDTVLPTDFPTDLTTDFNTDFSGADYLGQMTSGFLVFDTPSGLAIVDPHAAHERVAFTRIRRSMQEGMSVQRLLIPLLLPPTLGLEAEENRKLLEKFGFELESLDGGLQVTAVPAVGIQVAPEVLLRGSLAALQSGGDADPVELLWRSWATLACKEAVKVTTRMESQEAIVLWQDLHRCEQPFFCPHGRPTIVEWSNANLEKHFRRE